MPGKFIHRAGRLAVALACAGAAAPSWSLDLAQAYALARIVASCSSARAYACAKSSDQLGVVAQRQASATASPPA